MQSIAEEVVSSSGGGGTYITSGFSNYVGHSAIGFSLNDDTGYDVMTLGIGIIVSSSGNTYIDGASVEIIRGAGGGNMYTTNGTTYLQRTRYSASAIVF